MIEKFKTIKNLGVFSNFSSSDSEHQFKRFNLIYGANGSGKTTLSRFFDDLNEGSAAGFPDLKYKIQTNEGELKDGQKYSRVIRVFNSEYIENNIGAIEGRLNPIFIIGEENKSLVNQVTKDEDITAQLERSYSQNQISIEELNKQRSKIFTNIAKVISEASSGDVVRSYRKPQAETAYKNTSNFVSLDLEEYRTACQSIRDSRLENIHVLKVGERSFDAFERELKEISLDVKSLIKETASSIAIDRLVENHELSRWVEEGIRLHPTSKERCEFCDQSISADRRTQLEQHFNQSDAELKGRLTNTIQVLEDIRNNLGLVSIPRASELYSELRVDFQKHADDLSVQISAMMEYIDSLLNEVNLKLGKRTESYECKMQEYCFERFDAAFESLNSAINDHNFLCSDFDQRQKEITQRIEAHNLAAIHEDVSDIDARIKKLQSTQAEIKGGGTGDYPIGLDDLKKRISENKQKVSNSHKAAKELTEKLNTFLGRTELAFESEDEGYKITRSGRPASRLSEGEKTAITFLYFVVGLDDQDFDRDNGIIVIDDPISSLDSSNIYQAFSFLRSATNNCYQLFLFTHNFAFLKILIDWLKHHTKEHSFLMLVTSIAESGDRCSSLNPLDKALKNYSSEMFYLFSLLKKYEPDGSISAAYHMPNVIRKVLDTFLEQHGVGGTPYKRLESIEFDDQKKAALIKYANDMSHHTGSEFNPALVGETTKEVGILLEMIEEVAPSYYKALLKACA